MKNEKGIILIPALLILVLLTIIGISAVNTSITESRISTNSLIYNMNFYAAEGGIAHGVAWLGTLDLKDDTSTDWFTPLDADGNPQTFSLNNHTEYTWRVKHRTDADGNILYYGDKDGDYLFEVNTTTGVPLEFLEANGTHPRGGEVVIQTTWKFRPAFPAPQAALFGHSLIEKNGGSGAIWGEDQSGSGCADVLDIATDGVAVSGAIDVKDIVLDGGNGADAKYAQPLYPVPLVREAILYMSHDERSAVLNEEGYEGVLFVHPDADGNVDAKKLTGKGILFVDGNLDVNGGIGWEGMIIVYGELRVNGGGGLNTTGAIAAWGDVILNGSVSIKYDCESISDVFNEYSRYGMTSWRQM